MARLCHTGKVSFMGRGRPDARGPILVWEELPLAKNAADLIAAYNQGRDASRLALKYQAMRDNAFSFLRGTAHLFHDRMKSNAIDPGGPAAWICGDLHLENFGTYLGGNGLTYFDVNDFDEAALAPCTWDPLRFATSILIAAPIYQIQRAAALDLAGKAIESYRAELATGKPRWIERRTADGPIGVLIDGLKHRDPDKFIQKRTTAKGTRLDTGSDKMQPVTSAAERKLVKRYVEGLAGDSCLDVAYRIAGTGSLGIRRYVALMARKDASGDKHKVLLDLKAALPSSVAVASPSAQPAWANEAERIVAVQVHGQAIPPSLLQVATLGSDAFVLKELQPTADRLNLPLAAKDATTFASTMATMAALSAWAHLRSAGRLSAASPDALTAFANAKDSGKPILQAAKAMEKLTLEDWKVYCAAYDAGAFRSVLDAADKSKRDEAA